MTVAVSCCGVCRTDLQIVEGDLYTRRLPLVPGHQVVGRVVARGRSVRRPALGERVGIAWLEYACGRCRACRRGDENLCPRARFTGWDRDGGYAELVTAPSRFVHPIPDVFPDEQAAPLLCAGIIGYRALRLAGLAPLGGGSPTGRLGLFGFGSSARLALQVARYWGWDVYVFTRARNDRAQASSLGARWAGHTDEAAPMELDAAVSFAPAGEVAVAALRALAPGGTAVVNAIHLEGIPAFPYELLYGERTLRSVAHGTRADAREFLALAAEIPIRPQVTAYPLERSNQALRDMKSGQLQGSAVLSVATS